MSTGAGSGAEPPDSHARCWPRLLRLLPLPPVLAALAASAALASRSLSLQRSCDEEAGPVALDAEPAPLQAKSFFLDRARTGCSNWQDISKDAETKQTVSLDQCSLHCSSIPGCLGFNYQAAKCWGRDGTHSVGPGTCMILRGPCQREFRRCWDLYATLPPQTSMCPKCATPNSTSLTAVIPFFERDMCKMARTTESILKHDKDRVLSRILLLWVSERPSRDHAEEIEAFLRPLAAARMVQLVDFSDQVAASGVDGWRLQQSAKLKVSYVIETDFYVVLDSKNTLLQDLSRETFVTNCGQAHLYGLYPWGSLPPLHQQWYEHAVEQLPGVAPPPKSSMWPLSITPMVLHRNTVLEMLRYVGEDPNPDQLCNGKLCDMLKADATEFTLYLMYAQARPEVFACAHSATNDRDWEREVAVTLWSKWGRFGEEGARFALERNVEEAGNVASGRRFPTFFGVAHDALGGLGAAEKEEVARHLSVIFRDLFPADTPAMDVMACMS